MRIPRTAQIIMGYQQRDTEIPDKVISEFHSFGFVEDPAQEAPEYGFLANVMQGMMAYIEPQNGGIIAAAKLGGFDDNPPPSNVISFPRKS